MMASGAGGWWTSHSGHPEAGNVGGRGAVVAENHQRMRVTKRGVHWFLGSLGWPLEVEWPSAMCIVGAVCPPAKSIPDEGLAPFVVWRGDQGPCSPGR